MRFWNLISRFILKGRIFILLVLAGITALLTTQFKQLQFSHTEANILPKNHFINQQYERFLSIRSTHIIIFAFKIKPKTTES